MANPDIPDPNSGAPDVHDPQVVAAIDRHWRANIRLMTVLLSIWAIAGLGCGILFADSLNELTWMGFPVGFWFAQQGSIIVFVVLIFVYAIGMSRLDKKHRAELDALRAANR